MAKNIDELLKRLISEKFVNETPEWKDSDLGDLRVRSAVRDGSSYAVHNNGIFVQKPGKQDWTCYQHGVQIEARNISVPDWTEERSPLMGAGGGEVRHKTIPYCPNCQPEYVK